MAKRTKKVGIVGKYGTRYSASLWKMVKKIEISQHTKVHMLLLWQDQDEETSHRHLALWFLHENSGWRGLDLQHDFCRHSEVCHQKTEGTEGPVKVLPFDTQAHSIVHSQLNKWVNLRNS
ncbi:60S ribosomal protein L37a [Microtus ochrogaster]|uniref:60S ribosomal protein L37a n=1 Tax=Microtus ochrogaster TaxID=79684 RepID=A0A8J6KY17_MICOH|nr:60S ribosomal protein L37a [Microtus ochrogaster]KAH0507212.1 60S ribosomal protein L37a [Microtus ochrogaster]